jgi:hypothetical protein
MLIAFEGTGDSFVQRADFRPQNGFISQFVRNYNPRKGKAYYLSGPCLHGGNCGAIMNDGCRAIEQELRNGDEEINIIGYSRGGFSAIATARYVGLVHGKTVNFLGLFDAVKMAGLSGAYDTDALPGNIRYVYHAFRNPAAGSRTSGVLNQWGNTGYLVEKGVWTLEKAMFMTSHSGMGGWPGAGDVKENESEWPESKRAGSWMSGFAMRHGLIGAPLVPTTWKTIQQPATPPSEYFPGGVPGTKDARSGLQI